MAGISLSLAIWWVFRPWHHLVNRKVGANTILTGRGSLLPLLLRLVHPWIMALEPLGDRLLGWRARAALGQHIEHAGLSAYWTPSRLVALRMLGFMGLGLLGYGMRPFLGLNENIGIVFSVLGFGLGGWFLPGYCVRKMILERQKNMLASFPFLLDMVTLCVEAGLNLQGALQQAAQHGPAGPLRDLLRQALAEFRAGSHRQKALGTLADRSGLPEIRQWVQTLDQADQMGMNLGPVLRAQSEQRRAERFLRAEKLALQAPVKMLFPMVVCIFPCTFLIIGFPILVKLFSSVA